MSEHTLDQLAAELADLTDRVHRARTDLQTARSPDRPDDGDLQAMRNFIALAPFANPEHLPRFRRWIPTRRRARSVPPRAVPNGIPYPRRPRDAE